MAGREPVRAADLTRISPAPGFPDMRGKAASARPHALLPESSSHIPATNGAWPLI